MGKRVAMRLLAALVAVVQAFAPGAASIIDARPAALAMSERPIVHIDVPGTRHAIAHQEKCALCSLATHQLAEAGTPVHVPCAAIVHRPPRATWSAHHAAEEQSQARSRAPPA